MERKDVYKGIRARELVTMNGKDEIIRDGAVVIRNDVLEYVGTQKEAAKKYDGVNVEWMDHPKGVMLPGLVTPHTHIFQSLMKGVGSTLNLDDWVTKVIFPMSLAMDESDCYNAGMLNMAEMIRTGTTCFADSHYIVNQDENFDGIAEAVKVSGMRAILCRATQTMKYHPDVPAEMIESEETALTKSETCIQRYHDTCGGRLRVGLEPITPIDCTPEVIKGLFALAEKYDTLFQIHAAETMGEWATVKNAHKMGIMEYLDSLGVLSRRSMIIHGIWISAKEKALLADRKVKFAHNPMSNTILGDGIAAVPDLLSLGVDVGLGVDGAASNNNQDMFECMKVCALIHRMTTLDASVLSAYDVLKMATMGGARCLGLEKQIGSLEEGKKADVVVVDTDSIHLTPAIDNIANIVFSGNGRDVDTVLIDGELLLKNKEFVHLKKEEIIEKANRSADKMLRNVTI